MYLCVWRAGALIFEIWPLEYAGGKTFFHFHAFEVMSGDAMERRGAGHWPMECSVRSKEERFNREKKTYSEYDPFITIPQDKITQHYLKEVLRRPDIFWQGMHCGLVQEGTSGSSMASTSHPL